MLQFVSKPEVKRSEKEKYGSYFLNFLSKCRPKQRDSTETLSTFFFTKCFLFVFELHFVNGRGDEESVFLLSPTDGKREVFVAANSNAVLRLVHARNRKTQERFQKRKLHIVETGKTQERFVEVCSKKRYFSKAKRIFGFS